MLGEVMTLLEYREREMRLPYSKKSFSLPENLYVLATMNTADRSLALVDFALRRRLHAVYLQPDRAILERYLAAREESPRRCSSSSMPCSRESLIATSHLGTASG